MKVTWYNINTAPINEYIVVKKEGFHPRTGKAYTPVITKLNEDLSQYYNLFDDTWDDVGAWGLTHWTHIPE